MANALDKQASTWALFFLVVLGVVAIATGLMTSDDIPARASSVAKWIRPRVVGAVLGSVFSAFGVLTSALSLFEPRPAVESAPGAIEQKVDALLQRPNDGAAKAVYKNLPGIWGEPGCAVTFRFVVHGRAVTVTALRQPPGQSPYQLVATILSASDTVLEVTGEKPAAALGRAASFTYWSNGVLERLTWNDKSAGSLVVLDRCEERLRR